MSRKLTEEQVRKLFAFCESKDVYDYDLQIEIVDHLASAIEEQWKHDPGITFGWALKNIYLKFGWHDFRKLERQLERQLKRKFRRMLWQNFIEYFRFPKIAITVLLFIMLFSLLQIADNNSLLIILLTVPLSLASIYYNFVLFPKKIEIKSIREKSFLILRYLESINNQAGKLTFLPITVPLITMGWHLKYTNTLYLEVLIAAVLSLFAVLMYGYFFFLPKKIKEHFMLNYSEFAQ